MVEHFLVGCAREVITPDVGALLYGYRPDLQSESVHDDLTAIAMAFGDGERTVLLISTALCELGTEIADSLRDMIAKDTGIARENVLIQSFHTHSAPATASTFGWGDADEDYCENILRGAIKKVAIDALSSMCEAEMAIGTTKSDVGINRRQTQPDGYVRFGQNPFGLYDPNMTVLSFRRVDDKKDILNIIHYGAHCTAAGQSSEISRDWAGVMMDCLERESGAMTAFCNGALGDVGPRISNSHTVGFGNMTYVSEIGGVAAIDAIRAWKNRGEYRREKLKISDGCITLPYKALPSMDEIQENLARYKDRDTSKLINSVANDWRRWKILEEERLSGRELKTEHKMNTLFFALGPVVFLSYPLEIFSEISLRLRHYSDYPYVLTLSLINGYGSYFPSQCDICRGGYEIEMSRSGNLYNFTDDADNYLICESLRLMEELK